MSEPIPTDPVVDPDFPPEDPVPPEQEPVEPGPELPVVDGWLDAAAQAEADAKQYTDEQVPLIAGRLVPRNMDRAPTVEDGTDLIAGTGWNQYDPATNDLVQMWRWDGTAWQALDMSAEMIPVLDIGSATVGDLTGGRINVQSGPIVAGDPDGARVELTGDGFHAYDASGTETARIQGEGGEFVGGEFRTSDTLPGQVTLADDAYVDSAGGTRRPGISVIPVDTSNMATPPGIGASGDAILVNGGRNLAGGRAHLAMSPGGIYGEARLGSGQVSSVSVAVGETRLRSNGPNGDYGWARAQPGQAELAYIATDNTYFSRIRADANEAHLYTRAGGASRYLTVDADGIWVKTNKDGSWKHYNLEQTASDSGWRGLSPAGGFTPIPEGCDVRLLGRMVHFRGAVTGNVTTSWQTIATVPADFRPQVRQINSGASSSLTNLMFQTHVDGRLQVKANNSATGVNIFVNTIFYPVD